MSATMDAAAVAELAAQVSGSVLGPRDAGYDAARAVHNGLLDRRPAFIVRSRAAYGPNYERLHEVKRRYDPGNVFHLNHNVAP